jgi:photosynthetic reaction center H subunit
MHLSEAKKANLEKEMKNEEVKKERLVPLTALQDYKVAKDNPDVTGWRVLGADGESLGLVKDLIVDLQAMKARYLSVMADRRFFKTDSDQYLLVPIGAAALDKKARKVFISSLDAGSIQRYPLYPGGPVSADYELAVRDAFHQNQRDTLPDPAVSTNSSPQLSEQFYNTDTYNEDRFYTSDKEVYRDKSYASPTPDPEAARTGEESEGRKYKSVDDYIVTIERLESLREKGSITEEEFKILKKRALDF